MPPSILSDGASCRSVSWVGISSPKMKDQSHLQNSRGATDFFF